MAKITCDEQLKQSKITIPVEIMKIKKWDADTEIMVCPLLTEPKSKLSKDTPLIILEVNDKSKKDERNNSFTR